MPAAPTQVINTYSLPGILTASMQRPSALHSSKQGLCVDMIMRLKETRPQTVRSEALWIVACSF